MTNEEKAIELSNRFKCITIGERCKNIEDACYEMAKWKDKQVIEKACEWLELHMQCGIHPQNVSSTIKQFKKAMEASNDAVRYHD